jgi:hypothetical protein
MMVVKFRIIQNIRYQCKVGLSPAEFKRGCYQHYPMLILLKLTDGDAVV